MDDNKGPYVEYSSNNSGGDWWLTDEDWKALETAGWEVEWFADRTDPFLKKPYPDGRFLGALASHAKRYGVSLRPAIAEWEDITGSYSNDLGCSCCGTPHSFSEHDAEGNSIDSYWPDYPTQGSRY